jgi:hypothetical protein
MKDSFSDEMAMNWIADLIRDNGFDPETIERICKIVKLTGREISESFEV